MSREPRRVRILPCPGPGVHARTQPSPAPAAKGRDALPGTGITGIPWAHGFVPEPVSPDLVDPATRCQGQDATTVTEESFPNLVAAAVTLHEPHAGARHRSVRSQGRIARCRCGPG